MVKHILLKLDDDKFRALRDLKYGLEKADNKDRTWETFLCDWVLELYQMALMSKVDSMIDGVLPTLKPEVREDFEKQVKNTLIGLTWAYRTPQVQQAQKKT